MTKKRGKAPIGLDDIVIGSGLQAADAYGWDHSPRFPAGEEKRRYRDATTTLEAGFQTVDTLMVMTALGAIEKVTGLEPPPQRISIAGIELAQALMLRESAPGDPPFPAQLGRITDALEAHLHLFLGQTSKPRSGAKESLLTRRMIQT